MKNKYEVVIGLEIHAELKTNSKMFCSCANSTTQINTNENTNKHESKPTEQNMNVCPVCLGMPGMLPVLNKQAIEWTILTGLALNCKIAEYTKWDRKNYFYPDLPKGYQISQFDLPICQGGHIEITKNQKPKTKQVSKPNLAYRQAGDQNSKTKIGITRIHLEEDTGTSKHPEGRADVDYSLMDYNRAGVPLMELVTDAITLPIDQAGEIAKLFCQKYQLILRYLNVADADMEKGQMRCEANISVKPIGQKEFGIKVEVKNLNSFKSVEKAVEYETERQIIEIENGGKVIQETRGWDDTKNKTYTMRVKETSADYRYFPEPDLPPIVIGRIPNNQFPISKQASKTNNQKPKQINIDEIKKQLPELPDERLKKYIDKYQLKKEDAEILIYNLEMMEYFEKITNIKYQISNKFQISKSNIQTIVKWIINEVPDLSIKPEHLVKLVELISSNKISGKIAKEILPEIKKGKSPLEIIKEKRLEQISDTGELEKIVEKVIAKNPDVVAKIKSGQTQIIGFLVGQVMRESKGQANPKIVNEILRRKI